MSDNHTKEQRSYNMSRIRSTDTAPEEKVRKWLHSKGFRYRKNVNSLPGKPDIVLRKYKAIIFVHGCFWHKHDCGRFRLPQTNTDYWKKKITRNVERDKEVSTLLQTDGWRVFTVWECQLKKDSFEKTMEHLRLDLLNG
ncbi:very short patch repair endonuclease [Selenomonas ruminantium]|uniref:Very short patch repair endonuclease n=1 Tax=Selenomonas ruminantium TaxID=971 RepID=A0A1K1LVJ7_SELRU|nr:very short patch repair endonuclease [Selenomonas ruminantium]SFW14872.1 T/G mismatch-specific endonuclease [Selenomonas ruminantium]